MERLTDLGGGDLSLTWLNAPSDNTHHVRGVLHFPVVVDVQLHVTGKKQRRWDPGSSWKRLKGSGIRLPSTECRCVSESRAAKVVGAVERTLPVGWSPVSTQLAEMNNVKA